MNDLCADIGYKSINHVGEQLCGDHVDIVEQGDGSSVIVLADGQVRQDGPRKDILPGLLGGTATMCSALSDKVR